jgi:Cysteine dioxygenase type I
MPGSRPSADSSHPDGLPRIVPSFRALPAGALRPFGTKHIHKVTNNAWEPAVSLHVYAPALVEMNGYEVVDGERLRLADSQLAGRNW